MMKEKRQERKEARRFEKYVQLRRQASLARMISQAYDNLEEMLIALDMRFPRYSEAYARI